MPTLKDVESRIYNPKRKVPLRAAAAAAAAARGAGAVRGAGRLAGTAARKVLPLAVPASVVGGVLDQEQLPAQTIRDRGGFIPSVAKSSLENIPGGQSIRKFAAGLGSAAGAIRDPASQWEGRGRRPIWETAPEIPGAFMQGFNAEADAIANEQTQAQSPQADITIDNPAQVSAFLRDPTTGEPILDSNGQPMGISSSTDAHRALRQQLGTTGTGPGTVSFASPTAVGDLAAGTEARQAVIPAIRAALARGENVDINRYLGGAEDSAPSTQSQIADLENQLAQPGRGTNQTFDELLNERRKRNNIRRQLKSLYKQRSAEIKDAAAAQRSAQQQANSDRNFQLNLAKFGNQLNKQQQDAAKTELDTARKVHTANAKALYPEDPEEQVLYTAKQLELQRPGYLTSPEGLDARRIAKKRFIEEVQNERGLWDWLSSKLGFGSEGPTQDDIEKLNFKGWKISKGEMLLPESITSNKAYRGPKGYAYADNLDPETAWMVEQLIKMDNPQDYKKSVRAEQ